MQTPACAPKATPNGAAAIFPEDGSVYVPGFKELVRKDLAAANELCDQVRSSTAPTALASGIAEELAGALFGDEVATGIVEARGSRASSRQERRLPKMQHTMKRAGKLSRWAADDWRKQQHAMSRRVAGPGITWQEWQAV